MERRWHTGRTEAESMTFRSDIIPVQIRPDIIVQIANIPWDLSKSEAEKIAAVIMAMSGNCRARSESDNHV
jgi:hypothetical protein